MKDCHAAGCRVGDIHGNNIILAAGDRPFVIDLALGAALNRATALADVTAAVRLFSPEPEPGPYSRDFKKVPPNHAGALKARYGSATDMLGALTELMGG